MANPTESEELINLRRQLLEVQRGREEERKQVSQTMANPTESEELINLRRQLLEEQRGREEERKQVSQTMANPGENEELINLRRQLGEEQRRREYLEEIIRPTNLLVLLDACHVNLSMGLTVQADTTLSTQGDPANARRKIRPDRICEWKEFPAQQERIWSDLMDSDFITERHFTSLHTLKELGVTVRGRSMSSKLDLHLFARTTIEDHISSIIKELSLNPRLRKKFKLKGSVMFENHANMLSPTLLAEDGIQHMSLSDTSRRRSPRLAEMEMQTQQSELAKKVNAPAATRSAHPRADQFCVYHTSDETTGSENRVAAFIVEYKPPHKLTLGHINDGLEDMELEDVIKCDEDETFKVRCRRLVAAVITQAFSYMVKTGLEYGYVCTGEAFIFLHIPDDPTTVHYFLSVPKGDVGKTTDWEPDSDQPNRLHLTAIGQVLAFTLQALKTPPRNQAWRARAEEQLNTWEVVYNDVFEAMPKEEKAPSSEYRPPSHVMKEFMLMSPVRRSRRLQSSSVACASPLPSALPNDDEDDDDTFDPNTPSRRPYLPTSLTQQPTQAPPVTSKTGPGRNYNGKGKTRQYCSQKCLLGLVKGGLLDMECPNVLDHGNGHHAITRDTFLDLIYQQLSRDLDTDCESVGIQGSRGALFKITLTSHGYTVAAKGTVIDFVNHLNHEGAIYKHLRPIQGIHIPVYLGNLNLHRPYYYDGMNKITHMMFLSFGGKLIHRVINKENQSHLIAESRLSIQAIHQLGVLHRDPLPRNMLWNTEMEKVMMIDFERSKVLKGRAILGDISLNHGNGNRKRKLENGKGKGKGEEGEGEGERRNGLDVFEIEKRWTIGEFMRFAR